MKNMMYRKKPNRYLHTYFYMVSVNHLKKKSSLLYDHFKMNLFIGFDKSALFSLMIYPNGKDI